MPITIEITTERAMSREITAITNMPDETVPRIVPVIKAREISSISTMIMESIMVITGTSTTPLLDPDMARTMDTDPEPDIQVMAGQA